MQTNRFCTTCGKAYFYCSNCDKTLNSPQWMLMWHDENCKKVFEVVSDYAQKHITKEEAKNRLEKCNLKVSYTFKESIRKYIDEIFEEPKKESENIESNVSQKIMKKSRSQRGKRN